MVGDPARKVMAVLISCLTWSRAVKNQDQDKPCKVPRTSCQDTEECSRKEWLQGPGACKVVEQIAWDLIDDASQDKDQACIIYPALPGPALKKFPIFC